MIALFVATFTLSIILSYFLVNIPHLFLLFLFPLTYRYPKNWGTIFTVIILGFFNDVLLGNHYPILTLYYYLIFLILHKMIKHYVIPEYISVIIIITILFVLETFFLSITGWILNLKVDPFSFNKMFTQLLVTIIFIPPLFHFFRKQFVLIEDQ